MNNLRILSSLHTILMKVFFPLIWILVFGAGAFSLWFVPLNGKGEASTIFMRWAFLLFWILGTMLLLKTCAGLKQIRVDETKLYVSNFLTEIALPFDTIEQVTENVWINIHPVTIHFRGDTKFGRSVKFMPHLRFFAGWSPHPVVAELKRLAGIDDASSRS